VKGPFFIFEMARLTASRERWSRALRPLDGARSCLECAASFRALLPSLLMPRNVAAHSSSCAVTCTAAPSEEEPPLGSTARLLKLDRRPLHRSQRAGRVVVLLGVDVGSLRACRSDPQRRWLPSRWQRHLTPIRHHGLAASSKAVDVHGVRGVRMVLGDDLPAASSVRDILVCAQVMVHRAGWRGS
jgi:hypothetical protein